MKNWKISRRAVLRGIGASLALPFLDVMTAEAIPAVDGKRPVRLGYLYFPNGAAEGSWEAKKTGAGGKLLQLNKWMAPLEPFRNDIVIPRNIWTPHGNGHGAGTATWLTGHSYDGQEIDAGGQSVDQLAARHFSGKTLLPSLELSCRGEGHFSNDLPRNSISWAASNRPTSREVVPRTVYDRMFRTSRQGLDKSILDLVLADARSLSLKVSRDDRRKIDEYLESVRSVERRLAFADTQAKRLEADRALTDTLVRPQPGIPASHQEYVKLMLDMMLLAFWSNATRVCSFMLDHGQSNRYFDFIDGVKGTWHALSHYKDINGRTEDDDGKNSWSSVGSKQEMYNSVARWHHEQVAYLLGRMKEIREGDGGTLLDNSMILYGSSISDGHEHGSKNLPLLLAGGRSSTARLGRQLEFKRRTSLSDLHLSMLRKAGIRVEEFGDSEQPLAKLDG